MTTLAAFVAGKEGRDLSIPKASDMPSIPVNFLDAPLGSTHALSTATVDAVIYDRADRKNTTPIATIALTVATAADGKCTLSFTVANSAITPGRYYMFFRRTLAASITWSRKYTLLNVT
jgi:hypothetical protein